MIQHSRLNFNDLNLKKKSKKNIVYIIQATVDTAIGHISTSPCCFFMVETNYSMIIL